jgi:transposase
MEDNDRRVFSKDYKLQIVRMVKDGQKKVSELSEELGIQSGLLYRWIKSYEKNPEIYLPGDGKPTEKDEIRRLKKKMSNISEENEILKKALAIFSKQQKPSSR